MNASISMKVRPLPGPSIALPTTIIMSPMGAADPVALCIGVAAVQEVVRREILEQVTERPLHQQRRDHRDGDVALGVLGLASHRGHRFESDQNQNRDRGLHEHPAEVVHADHRAGVGMAEEVALFVLVGIGDLERHRLAGGIQLRLAECRLVSRTMVSVGLPFDRRLCRSRIRRCRRRPRWNRTARRRFPADDSCGSRAPSPRTPAAR